ncbi:unnamed protein product [Calypogeia fissa]
MTVQLVVIDSQGQIAGPFSNPHRWSLEADTNLRVCICYVLISWLSGCGSIGPPLDPDPANHISLESGKEAFPCCEIFDLLAGVTLSSFIA